jgi:hypothetical protein
MSTWSVQNEAGAGDFTDVAPLPILDFWLWFFAVALGADAFAFAATVGPTLTLGAFPVPVCDGKKRGLGELAKFLAVHKVSRISCCTSR